MNQALRQFWRDETGAAAAEFALILAPLLLFVFGFFHMCMMMYTVTQLHWAAEDAARCATVRYDCKVSSGANYVTNKGLTEAWARARYKGLTTAPTFTYSLAGCGNQVTATVTYPITLPLFSRTFALRSDACFPA